MRLRPLTPAFACLALACTDPGSAPTGVPDAGILDAGVPDVGVPDAGGPSCPPTPPFGTEVGSTLMDIVLEDCDGNPVRLHDLCGAPAGLVFNFYGWCTGCYRYMRAVEDIHADYGPMGLRTVVVILEDAVLEPATREYCRNITEYFGLTTTVAIDPGHLVEAYGDADTLMITDEEANVVFLRQGATVDAVRRALETELAD